MRLPRQDEIMGLILLGLMAIASLTAAVAGGTHGPIPLAALLAMPATLGLIWASFALTWAIGSRLGPEAFRKGGPVMLGFMGKSMVMAGITITLAHLGMLAAYAGLLQEDQTQLFLRLVFVALALNLAYMHNLMPKLRSKAGKGGADLRLIGWVGVVCCLGMALVGAFMPIDEMTPAYLGLGMVSPVLVLISTALRRLRRKGA